jgi:hypothetical protein
MKLNQIQVCLDCEECYVGDFCPKCGSGAYFYLRKYFPPMRKFGGHYEPVQVHINPVQERVQRIQGNPAVLPVNFAGDTIAGSIMDGDAQAAHPVSISDCGRAPAGPVAKAGGLDRTSRVLGEAISRLLKICRGLDASPSSDMGTSMDKKRIDEPGDEYIGRDENIKGLYEREQNT